MADLVGGAWLKWMVFFFRSGCALFAEICEDAFLLLGMSEMGLAPKCSSHVTEGKTPTCALIAGAFLVVTLSTLGPSCRLLRWTMRLLPACAEPLRYGRFKRPDLARPFKFPVSDWQLVTVLTPALLTVIVGF